MKRIIYADDLEDQIEEAIEILKKDEFGAALCVPNLEAFLLLVKEQPSVNDRPVAHWEFNPNANDWGVGGWCCSRCHFKNDILGTSEKLKFPIRIFAGTRFCGQCGARMSVR